MTKELNPKSPLPNGLLGLIIQVYAVHYSFLDDREHEVVDISACFFADIETLCHKSIAYGGLFLCELSLAIIEVYIVLETVVGMNRYVEGMNKVF